MVGAPLRHQTNERNPAKGLVRRRTLIGAYRPVCCLLHRRDGSGRRPRRSWQVNLRARRVRITCDTHKEGSLLGDAAVFRARAIG